MKVVAIALLLVVINLRTSEGQEAESLPSLRQALLESYEAMEAARADLQAAEKAFEAADEKERAKAVELLTKIAKEEIRAGDLGEARKVYSKVLELKPYNKDAEQFFMSTGAGEVRKQIIVKQMMKNAVECIEPLDLRRAKTWMAVANDIEAGNQDVDLLTTSIESLDELKRAIVEGKAEPVQKKPMTKWSSMGGFEGVPFSQFKKLGNIWIEEAHTALVPKHFNHFTEDRRVGDFVELSDTKNIGNKVRIHHEGILYTRTRDSRLWKHGYEGKWHE